MATRIALVPRPEFEPVPIKIAGYAAPEPQAPGGEAPPEALSAYAPGVGPAFAGGAELRPDPEARPLKGRPIPHHHETSRSKAKAELAAARAHGKTVHQRRAAAHEVEKSKGKVASHSKHSKEKAAEAKGGASTTAAGKIKAEAHLKQKPENSSSAKRSSTAVAKASRASKAESSATQ